jgi:hypothetical protein
MEEKNNACTSFEHLNIRHNLESLDVDEKIELKWILKKQN